MKNFLVVGCLLFANSQAISAASKVDARFRATTEHLSKYQRPITVIDLTPGNGNLVLQLAKKHDGVFVMAESIEPEKLVHRCTKDKIHNVIVVSKELTPYIINRMSQCEYFDVILALDVVTKFGADWKKSFDEILKLGDYVMTEAPTNDVALYNYFKQKGGTVVDRTNSHEVFLFTCKKEGLTRHTWNATPAADKKRLYQLYSSFNSKKLIKDKPLPGKAISTWMRRLVNRNYGKTYTTWLPGINLLSFKELAGVYPEKRTIRELLEPMKTLNHDDLYIFNLIVQGQRLLPIDGTERPFERYDNEERATKIQGFFRRGLFNLGG